MTIIAFVLGFAVGVFAFAYAFECLLDRDGELVGRRFVYTRHPKDGER